MLMLDNALPTLRSRALLLQRKKKRPIKVEKTMGNHSTLFFPSSKPSSLASLLPRSCFEPTSEPTTGLWDTLVRLDWYASTWWGRRLSLGQLTYVALVYEKLPRDRERGLT